MLIELLFRYNAWELIYSNNSFINAEPEGLFFLQHYLVDIKANYLVFIYALIMLLFLNVLGVGRNLVSVLLFCTYAILHGISNKYSNGGDQIALLLSFYLSPANCFEHFTLIKRKPFSERKEKLYNLISNLAAYSIMINLAFVYFMAGLGKLQNPIWLKGEAIYYYMNGERFLAFRDSQHPMEMPVIINYILNYGTILLELTAPFLIWFKKTKTITFLLLFLMHAGIYFFLMIYGMSVIFVLQYGMFYSEAEIKQRLITIKGCFYRKK